MDGMLTDLVERDASESWFAEQSLSHGSTRNTEENQYTADNHTVDSSTDDDDDDAMRLNPPRHPSKKGKKDKPDRAKAVPIAEEEKVNIVGYHLHEPTLAIFARIAPQHGGIEYRPRFAKREYPEKIQRRWASLVLRNGCIQADKVILTDTVLRGTATSDEKAMKQLTKEYLQLTKATGGDPEGAQLSEQDKETEIRRRLKENVDIERALAAAVQHEADLARVAREYAVEREGRSQNADTEFKAMEEVLAYHIKQQVEADKKIIEQENEIKALRAIINGDTAMAGDLLSARPQQVLFGPYEIGGRLYGQIPAGSLNEGFYVELGGQVKDNYRETNVLSEYKQYNMGNVVEDGVMVNNTEFCRTAEGTLVEKQEDFVEASGRVYTRRRVLAPYHGAPDG